MDTTIINTNHPIGVFDSGCGGLTVLRVLHSYFPHENFVYYADTAHLPYGTKSPEEIQKYTHDALTWLQDVAHVKLIVVACHTSSAIALEPLKHIFKVPIVGTIYPLVENILKKSCYKKIGIIATPASTISRMHEKILYENGFTGNVTSIACPTFVPLIERSDLDTVALTTAAKEYLQPFHSQSLDTLVYGCTHYPLIAPIIQSLLPGTMQYVDPAYAIADTVASVINRLSHSQKNDVSTSTTQYFCSNNTALFSTKVAYIMQIKPSVKLVHTTSTS